MEMMTFVFVENEPTPHWSKSVVTAETREECVEKYFLKYPERSGEPALTIYDGDRSDIDWKLGEN